MLFTAAILFLLFKLDFDPVQQLDKTSIIISAVIFALLFIVVGLSHYYIIQIYGDMWRFLFGTSIF